MDRDRFGGGRDVASRGDLVRGSGNAARPWHDAVKIIEHDDYSFFNPEYHPMFDQHDGRSFFFEATDPGGKVALRFSGDLWQHAHGVLFSPSGPFPSQPPRSKHIRPGGEAAYVVVSAANSSDKAKSKVLPPGIEEKLSCSLTGSYHSK